jgi:heat shock protein HslJ
VHRLLFVAGAALLISHCGAPGGVARPAERAAPVTLAEIAGEWDIVAFAGYRPEPAADGQRRAFVDIQGDRVSFAIGCNQTGMSARIVGDQLIATSSDNAQTEIACGSERSARDAAFFAFMRSGPAVSHAGDELILERGSLRLHLTRR